ncbi:MAG TPA: L-glutamate gamma-semialdehyde dehydrogenase [Acidisphaera sp.]|nr:L-glutamate gamma-semialdehyde dehydrogenase [Acidisphaera sp.]
MPFDALAVPLTPLRRRIAEATRADEAASVQALIPEAQLSPDATARVAATAGRLIARVRTERSGASGVDALMREFSLSSQEGVALMCLAEALLRIPDRATADRLIRDKIAPGDWRAHLGHSPSLFVNAAAWGLLVTGKLVGTASEHGLGQALTRLVARGGEPLIRAGVDLAMRLLGRQFVLGEDIESALRHAQARERRGYRFSYDMLGEAALTAADAARYLTDYERAIDAIGSAAGALGPIEGPGISVKLSALHPRYARFQRDRVLAELGPKLSALAQRVKCHGISINIDAEEADRLDLSLDLLEALAHDPELAGWDGIGFVVQAYQKRAPFVVDWIVDLARRTSHRFMLRLVKGAYWDSEIKRAQEAGLDGFPVFTRKVHTDVAYLACARRMLAASDAIYPQFATHNAHTLAWLHEAGQGVHFEYQCLHGMGETLYDQVVGNAEFNRACRIYAPVGTHETLLAYLVRRLLENGSNSSFVNRVVDPAVPVDELTADPGAAASATHGAPHTIIRAPLDLYEPERRNAPGIDLADEIALDRLDAAMRAAADASAPPDVAPDAVAPAIAAAAASDWSRRPAEDRARVLCQAADLFETNMPALMRIAVQEAGKTLPNAVGEVREAVDFLRYYAARGVELAGTQPLGPAVCISPWNFPLAIFTGQVAAALAAGNPVLAKPAEQTPAIAAFGVRLLHEAGVPADALHLLPGPGETVGAALCADPRVAAVLFTGSTDVARAINRALGARPDGAPPARLIAETGGQNAMIVDSSALLEQVVLDAITSAFDSAGQRCSALRVLYLQDDIADRAIAMLRGAMDELRVGDPSLLATDIGPVIDLESADRLRAHIERMRPLARWLHQTPADADLPPTFMPPTAMEIADIAQIGGEVFGPVLHVIRYAARELPRVLDAVAATGYGLTFGVHSRIDETIDACSTRASAGNVYVNRSIIGAVVGTQPFGGRGLSGTGPKAGGLVYLTALVRDPPPPPDDPARARPAELAALRACLQRLPIDAAARTAVEAAMARDHARSLLGRRITLPGPTGETNTLTFEPRGTVACLAADLSSLLPQLFAAFATGNRVVLTDTPDVRTLKTVFPAVTIAADPLAGAVDAVLAEAVSATLRRRLAERDGPILPLIVAGPEGSYDLRRLVAEKTVSVNTTAAGGNASLMALGA